MNFLLFCQRQQVINEQTMFMQQQLLLQQQQQQQQHYQHLQKQAILQQIQVTAWLLFS